MSARDKLPAAPPQDLADHHALRIHRAKQQCRPVEFAGKNHFIAGFCHHDGDAEMVVYLKGCADAVKPSDITILEQPK